MANQVCQHKDYIALIDAIDHHGFIVREQGASVDRFVSQRVERRLRAKLLEEQVPNDATVIVRAKKYSPEIAGELSRSPFELIVEGRDQPIDVILGESHLKKTIRKAGDASLVTAYHEAGHHVTEMALLSDKLLAKGLALSQESARSMVKWSIMKALPAQKTMSP